MKHFNIASKILIPLLLTSVSVAAEKIDLQSAKNALTPPKNITDTSEQQISSKKDLEDPRIQRTPVDLIDRTSNDPLKDLNPTRLIGPGSSGGGQGVLMNDGSYRFLDLIPDSELKNIRKLPTNYFNYGRCVNHPFYTIPGFQFPLKNIEARLKKANIPSKALIEAGTRLQNKTVFSSAPGLFVAQDSSRIQKNQQINIGVNTGEYLVIFEPVFQKLSERDREAFFFHEILRQYVYIFSVPFEAGMTLREIEKAVHLLYNSENSQEINSLIKTNKINYQNYETAKAWLDLTRSFLWTISENTSAEKLKHSMILLSDAYKRATNYSILFAMSTHDDLLELLGDINGQMSLLKRISNYETFDSLRRKDDEFLIAYLVASKGHSGFMTDLHYQIITRSKRSLESNLRDLESVNSDLRRILFYGDTSVLNKKIDKATLIKEGIILPPEIFQRKEGKVWSIGGKQWTSPNSPVCWGSTF